MNRRTFLACIPALPMASLPAAKAAPLGPVKQQIIRGKAGEWYVRALCRNDARSLVEFAEALDLTKYGAAIAAQESDRGGNGATTNSPPSTNPAATGGPASAAVS